MSVDPSSSVHLSHVQCGFNRFETTITKANICLLSTDTPFNHSLRQRCWNIFFCASQLLEFTIEWNLLAEDFASEVWISIPLYFSSWKVRNNKVNLNKSSLYRCVHLTFHDSSSTTPFFFKPIKTGLSFVLCSQAYDWWWWCVCVGGGGGYATSVTLKVSTLWQSNLEDK